MSIYPIRYTYRIYLILFIQYTLCYGWRVGFVHSKCNRIRVNRPTGIESDLKLYIHYRIILLLIMPPRVANGLPNEKPRYGRGAFVRSNLTWASKPTSGAQITQVILGWGAIWPSLGPLVATKCIQDRCMLPCGSNLALSELLTGSTEAFKATSGAQKHKSSLDGEHYGSLRALL